MPKPAQAEKRKAPLYRGLAIFLLAFGVALWLGNRTKHLPLETPDLQAKEDRNQKKLPTASPLGDRLQPSKQKPNAPPFAIANERILSFKSDADYRRFLETAHPSLQILAKNEALRAVRIQFSGDIPDGALPDSAQSDFNYTLLTPSPVYSENPALDKVFGSGALDFIGVPHSNSEAGKGVTVAILDTGIRGHSTLNELSIERFGTSDPSDYRSHGTAVASLVAGQEGTGIAPQAQLISIQVLDTDGIGDTFTLAEGIVQAVDAGANIINMSLGSYGSNTALANAVEYANSRGVVLVASAGNEAVTALPYPAAYESVIAVSAIDAEGHPTSFSNQSDSVSIAAPGVGVYAAWEDDKWISFTGTSASAPYVSGAIAALSSELDVPASEAASILLANANDSGLPGDDQQLGRGYIDLKRSMLANTSYSDLALADIYLAPNLDANGQNTVYITVQNRGTQTIPTAQVSYVLANGITQNTYLGSLEPGETAAKTLNPTSSELESKSGYKIEATVSSGSRSNDLVPQNDTRSVTLTTTSDEQPLNP